MWHKWWDGKEWQGWEDLGGTLTSAPAAVSWGPNRIDCFIQGTDNHLWHKWWDGKEWQGWKDLGGVLTSAPTVCSRKENYLDEFVRGNAKNEHHKWHKWWNGSQWSGWEDRGGILTSAPSAVSWDANRIDCFVRGTDNHLWHRWWDGYDISDLAAADWRWSSVGGKITFYPVFQNVGTKDFKPTQPGEFNLNVRSNFEDGSAVFPIEVGAFGTFGLKVDEKKTLVPGCEINLYTNGQYNIIWSFEHPEDMNKSNNTFKSETIIGSEIETKYSAKRAF